VRASENRAFAMAEPPPNPLSAAMAHELNGNAVAPLFSAAPGAAPAAAIDLDDVFADCFFGREGDADLLDDIAAAAPAAAPPPPPPQKKRSRAAPAASDMTEAQRDERRERNREHAKRSRVRKKFLLESLQQSVNALQFENDKLRTAIREKLGSRADELLREAGGTTAKSLIARDPAQATRVLDDPDYSLVKALQTAQQNFVITDPSLPDNPIVFASQGFLTLTGYALESVLGRNCRFLQGPRTDPRAVAKIRKAVDEGYDTSVCLLNYRIDGSTFYNQFFVAPLRDGAGNVVNYVGVQCQVTDQFAAALEREARQASSS
jgi:PAS domain S-box-containing protein|tara:strand:- start:61 stop:1020 length:960 start_codon:yes stop_codon:yes gene_type:complete